MAVLRRYDIKTKTHLDTIIADLSVAPRVMYSNTISDRQFFQQLAIDGYITEPEALTAVATGALPIAIDAIVSSIPADSQFAARMVLSGATRFERHHPLVEVFASAIGMDVAELN